MRIVRGDLSWLDFCERAGLMASRVIRRRRRRALSRKHLVPSPGLRGIDLEALPAGVVETARRLLAVVTPVEVLKLNGVHLRGLKL